MFKDFKAFIMRGNVVDLAVAVIVGASFGKIVSSVVNDVIMPPIGRLLGKVDFSNLFLNLSGEKYASLKEAKDAGAATINYGIFLNVVLDFLIVSAVVFVLIRLLSKLQRQKAAPVAEPTTKECPYCISSIPVKATRCPNCTSQVKAG
jgi:large conductance mechanosensitive channel